MVGNAALKAPQVELIETKQFATKYQAIFDQASDAVVTVTEDGCIDTLNHAAEELTGFLKSELCGMSVGALAPDPGHYRIPERARPISEQVLYTPGTYEDIAIVRKDGYVRLVDMSVRFATDGKTTLVIALFRDVTEKKKMERELITKHAELRNACYQLEKKNAELESMQQILVQAGKMAALGELAAGIAHELNQPLQSIRGYAQEVQDLGAPVIAAAPTRAELENGLGEIVRNVDKMAAIIQYLRGFVRKSSEGYEQINVHAALEESLKMLDRQFASRGIQVVRELDPELHPVFANPVQIEQILINLATNARDAIESTGRGSGTIRILTRNVGRFVEIVFSDDGCGMSERTRAKAFNPFFTTKEVGSGMGLGLSLSYGMISQLHGTIVVESEIGKGTTFIIRLPQDYRELA